MKKEIMGRPRKYNTEEERKAAHREADKRWRENNKDKIHEYRQNNKEKITEYQAAYRATHKEEMAAYDREYCSKNKEKIAAKKAEYRAAHKEELAEKKAEYYSKNKDNIRAQETEYRKNNRDKIRAKKAAYYATPFGRASNLVRSYHQKDKKSNRGECTIDAQWIVDNVFSGQVCHYCGESDWHLLGCDRKDSSLPHTPENCVPCCKACNDKKHTTPYEKYLEQINKSDTD